MPTEQQIEAQMAKAERFVDEICKLYGLAKHTGAERIEAIEKTAHALAIVDAPPEGELVEVAVVVTHNQSNAKRSVYAMGVDDDYDRKRAVEQVDDCVDEHEKRHTKTVVLSAYVELDKPAPVPTVTAKVEGV